MDTSTDSANLLLRLCGTDGAPLDAEEIADRLAALCLELREAPFVESVALGAGAAGGVASPGSKGVGEAMTAGALALAVLPVALPALIDFLKGWAIRNRRFRMVVKRGDDSIEIELDPDAMPAHQMEDWIGRLRRQLDAQDAG
jgi:hypothetical protein